MPDPGKTGFLSTLTGYYKGAVHSISSTLTGGTSGNHNYISDSDTEETATTTTQYRTVVVYGTPLRDNKFVFVPEMNDFYSDSELNTLYHSADEYRNAVKKYGLIYKHVKFDNADTTTKLLNYAKDYIKNNYHGGIISFTITALDMRLAGDTGLQKYTIGRRVPVKYIDPETKEWTSKTLTVITAEYDLNNPEKNQYKVGIPDMTLNKVYGETSKSKSGGGGGGGGKPSDETDDETNTEVDELSDIQEVVGGIIDEGLWAHFTTGITDGFDLGEAVSNLKTPLEKNPTASKIYGFVADAFKSSSFGSTIGTIQSLASNFIKVDGKGIETRALSSDKSNTGVTNADSVNVVGTTTSKDIEATNNVNVAEKTTTKNMEATNKTKTKDLEATNKTTTKDLDVTNNVTVTEKTKTKDLEVTGTMTVGGKAIALAEDIPEVQELKTVEIVIDNIKYKLYGQKVSTQ